MNKLPIVVSIFDQSAELERLHKLLNSEGYQIVSPTEDDLLNFCLGLPEINVIIIDHIYEDAENITQDLAAAAPNVPIIWLTDSIATDKVMCIEGVEVIALAKPLPEQALLKVLNYCVRAAERNRMLQFVQFKSQELQTRLATSANQRGRRHGDVPNKNKCK